MNNRVAHYALIKAELESLDSEFDVYEDKDNVSSSLIKDIKRHTNSEHKRAQKRVKCRTSVSKVRKTYTHDKH